MPLLPRHPLSERELAARRANARRSTGPRTPQGKARVRLNGLKHGGRSLLMARFLKRLGINLRGIYQFSQANLLPGEAVHPILSAIFDFWKAHMGIEGKGGWKPRSGTTKPGNAFRMSR
jgi:hypothetical protein